MMADAIDSVDFDIDHSGCVIVALLGEVAGEGRYLLWLDSKAEGSHIKLLLSPFLGNHAYRLEWHVVESNRPEFAKAEVLEGIRAALLEDMPGTRRVSGIRFAVLEASYHGLHSTPQAFRLAAQLAVRNALSEARLGKT
jgi:translation elongation factor EF-G